MHKKACSTTSDLLLFHLSRDHLWTNYLQTIRKLTFIIDIWWLSFNLNPNFSNWQNDLYSSKTISKTIFLTVRIYIIFEEIYLIRFKYSNLSKFQNFAIRSFLDSSKDKFKRRTNSKYSRYFSNYIKYINNLDFFNSLRVISKVFSITMFLFEIANCDHESVRTDIVIGNSLD